MAICRSKTRIVAASGLIAGLAAPLGARAASFSDIFSDIKKPNQSNTSLQSAIDNIFNHRLYVWMIWAVSIGAIAGILYGSYLYLTAQGQSDKAEQAKRAVIYAVIGIVILGSMLLLLSASQAVGSGAASGQVGNAL